MHNLVISAPPPNLDSFAPELCHCGKRTIETHEFWYCSTSCAREDSLQSLGNNRCHYRENVRKAHALAGQGPHLRRIMSVDHLRRAASERRGLFNKPPRVPSPKSLPQRNPTLTSRDARDRNVAGFPTLNQVTGKILVHKANTGEKLAGARQDLQRQPIAPSCTLPVETYHEQVSTHISLDAIPLAQLDPLHSPKRVPKANDGLQSSIRKSVTALLAVGRSWKRRDNENTERMFGHPANTFLPPVREEWLPSHRQKSPSSTIPTPPSRTLRRSASFACWDTPLHDAPSNQDLLMHIIEELREELSENFDPKSFELNEAE